jgi:hypothetical protein
MDSEKKWIYTDTPFPAFLPKAMDKYLRQVFWLTRFLNLPIDYSTVVYYQKVLPGLQLRGQLLTLTGFPFSPHTEEPLSSTKI